jgi:hypothetical protein
LTDRVSGEYKPVLWEKEEKTIFGIPPTRFELVSQDPKSCMIDRYTTGVFNPPFPEREKGELSFGFLLL